MIAIIAGSTILAALLVAILYVMVCTVGWRPTVGIWAITLAMMAIVTAGVFLITYGIEGHL